METAFGTAIAEASTTVLSYIATALPLICGVAVAMVGVKLAPKLIKRLG